MAEMTDDELIRYCDSHCETQRALFHRDHVNRMLSLAGHPEGWAREVPEYQQWLSVHDEMKDLCELARERKTLLASPPPDNVVSMSKYKEQLDAHAIPH